LLALANRLLLLVPQLRQTRQLADVAALRALLLRGESRAIPILERIAAEDRHEIVRHRAEAYLGTLRDPFGRHDGASSDTVLER